MVFKIGDLDVMTTSSITVPVFGSGNRPNVNTGTVALMIYNTTTAYLEIFDQGVWKDLKLNTQGGAFLYRQIITTGFVAGGYQNSSPWRNVNRMTHSTDVMTNLGDLLTYAGAYTSGACGLVKAYLWSTPNAFDPASSQTSSFNMFTETNNGIDIRNNMLNSRNDCGTIQKETQYAYVTGGGTSNVDLYNFATEIMTSGAVAGQTGGPDSNYGCSGMNDELAGYWFGNTGQKVTFGTATAYTVAGASNMNTGCQGQQKGISSKYGRGYHGNEGNYNGGYNLRRYVFATETYTTVGKPIGNSGEENFDQGQNWQYMMGCYDGSQNNRTWKFNYATDAGAELGAGSTRTGVPGGSSGHCMWRGS